MDLTLFLARVIGWYFVIISLYMLCCQQALKAIITDILGQRALMFFIALLTVILGLLLVISHNVWVMGWPVIITLIAWLVLIGGVYRLINPDLLTKVAQWWLRNPAYLIIAAILYLIIGLYLLYRAYFI
ncbi:TPA: hypothetical protein ACPSKE_002094 [Legionella feeleii]|uniref:Integral membrane protein (PIN domain superfamily) n=1 Tax=Legionella feeleii TaxID=453 RepID=A0A0W0TGV0_9GAMM|nr:hypothetical protein [Legionella feeleii]KTC94798.1 Integral membrane protein (PIN domain superfamily) [Legionella feeleii]SPX60407.1 Integral membrane protein (PIN domain superfamily) [Legionella feeleii]STX37224.1 Integral membrane protein (PIN domain superfamily) [Legionella feeleii]